MKAWIVLRKVLIFNWCWTIFLIELLVKVMLKKKEKEKNSVFDFLPEQRDSVVKLDLSN